MSFKVINKQDRRKLAEGRDHGVGYAFAKRENEAFTTIMPVSPCKDYLNDVVYSEATGKPFEAHGLKTKKQNIFTDKFAYMIMSVCRKGCNELLKYNGYEKDLNALKNNHKKIETFIHHFEDKLKLPDKTSIDKAGINKYVISTPIFWTKATYLISFYTLLIRAALYYEDGDPMTYLNQREDGDAYMIKKAMLKFNYMVKNGPPKQDFDAGYRFWHNEGIISFEFPKN